MSLVIVQLVLGFFRLFTLFKSNNTQESNNPDHDPEFDGEDENNNAKKKMRYGLGTKLLVSFLVGGLAILYKYGVNPRNNASEISSIIHVPRPFLFNLVSDTNNVPLYFHWVTDLYEADIRKNISVGKLYLGKVKMPYFGEYNINYKISEVKHGQWIILKPDPLVRSFLNAELIVMFNSITNTETQFYVKVVYHRTSALFQMTVAPFLKQWTDEELQQTSMRVEEMAMQKWKEWQATNITKAKTGSTTTTAKTTTAAKTPKSKDTTTSSSSSTSKGKETPSSRTSDEL